MSYIPIIWFLISVPLAPYRPGFLLGCAILSYQFDTLYGTEVLGQVLFVLLVGVISFSSLVQKRIFAPNRYDALVILFAALYLFSTIHAPNISVGLNISSRLIALGCGYYFIGRLLTFNIAFSRKFFTDFGVSILLLSGIFSLIAISQFTGLRRLTLGAGSSVGFTQMIDLAVGYSLFHFFSAPVGEGFLRRAIMFIIVLLMGSLLAFSGTRGVAVGLVFAVCVYTAARMFSRGDGTSSVMRNLVPLGLVLVGVMAVMVQLGARSELAAEGLSRLGINFLGGAGLYVDESSSIRLAIYNEAWRMFSESPFLGAGVGGFNALTALGHPHNMFLELLAETGIVTATVFGTLIGATTWMAIQLIRTHSVVGSIAAGIFLISLAHHQLSFALWMGKPLFLMMGIIVTLDQRRNRKQPPVKWHARIPEGQAR